MTSALATLAAHCREISVERPRLVGVYFLIENDVIVYVGQSSDIETRLWQHVTERSRPLRNWCGGEPRANPACKQFDRALWFPVAAQDLDAYEGALIRALNPEQTFSAPLSTGRDAEVLATLGLSTNADAHREFLVRRKTRFSKPHATRGGARSTPPRERNIQRGRANRLWSALAVMFAARAS